MRCFNDAIFGHSSWGIHASMMIGRRCVNSLMRYLSILLEEVSCFIDAIFGHRESRGTFTQILSILSVKT